MTLLCHVVLMAPDLRYSLIEIKSGEWPTVCSSIHSFTFFLFSETLYFLLQVDDIEKLLSYVNLSDAKKCEKALSELELSFTEGMLLRIYCTIMILCYV